MRGDNMYDKIRILLCHPKWIGLYYKDSVLKILAYILIVISLCFGAKAIVDYNTDYFTNADAKYLTTCIVNGDKSDITYSMATNEMTGTPLRIERDNFILSFLEEEPQELKDNMFIFLFSKDSIQIRQNGTTFGDMKYKDIISKDISFSEIQDGNYSQYAQMQGVFDIALNRINGKYANVCFLQDIMHLFNYFIGVFVVCVAFSFFDNPSIAHSIRLKLVFYTSGIYFVVMTFAFIFGWNWLTFVAFFLPIIYEHITFTHIVRVENKR